jgi:hypothetical protein
MLMEAFVLWEVAQFKVLEYRRSLPGTCALCGDWIPNAVDLTHYRHETLRTVNFSHPCSVFASRLTVTLWQGDRNLIKHHSFCTAHRCPRFRWHELIWIIHWGGLVTSFQATAVSAICWAARALGGSDRALVWRGNPYFEYPPAGNLNEFKLHLSVSHACVCKFYFSASKPPLFVILSLTQMVSQVQCVKLYIETSLSGCIQEPKSETVIFLPTARCQLVWFLSNTLTVTS